MVELLGGKALSSVAGLEFNLWCVPVEEMVQEM